MARRPKPWFRKQRNAWFVTIGGKQIPLGPNKKKAYRRFHELMANPQPVIHSHSLLAVFDAFLGWTEKNRTQATYEWHLQRLREFAQRVKNLRVHDLKPYMVQAWIDTKKADGHKRGCIISVSRALNWSVKQGIIAANPIRYMEKPKPGRRDPQCQHE